MRTVCSTEASRASRDTGAAIETARRADSAIAIEEATEIETETEESDIEIETDRRAEHGIIEIATEAETESVLMDTPSR
jgi:hypothetical protein